jgi:hypothetical protein
MNSQMSWQIQGVATANWNWVIFAPMGKPAGVTLRARKPHFVGEAAFDGFE